MLIAIIVTLAIVALLAYALDPGQSRTLIVSRPYNNRYSDAAGAREDHVG